MNGSEKQITWAEQIKQAWLNELNETERFMASESGRAYMVRQMGEEQPVTMNIHEAGQAIASVRAFIEVQNDASVFIDSRNSLPFRAAKTDRDFVSVYEIITNNMFHAKRINIQF